MSGRRQRLGEGHEGVGVAAQFAVELARERSIS
jgi:hypothetical protein